MKPIANQGRESMAHRHGHFSCPKLFTGVEMSILLNSLSDEWPFPPGAVLAVWFVFVFILGCCIGSLLNVCIYRLAWEKSILWPLKSFCTSCYQPIKWHDNLPLISYLVLRGRCRTCKARFSSRYFLVELVTGSAFVVLFYLHAVRNIYGLEALKPENLRYGPDQIQMGLVPLPAWLLFGFHALLFCFLLVASFIDIDHMEIPLVVTCSGAVMGLILGSMLWPLLPAEAGTVQPFLRPQRPIMAQGANQPPRLGIYPAPAWNELPAWLPPGSWKTGLATGLVGVLVGTLMLRAVRFSFSAGRGREGMGVGDADLMMMAGAFVGWQVLVLAFFVSVLPALFFGIVQLVRKGDQQLPYGPSLAVGIMAVVLGWAWIPPTLRGFFFDGTLVATLGGAAFVFLFLAALALRLVRGTPPQGENA
jgi:leader peptidase (prepilin peptidase)/N-methyltransferase